MISKLQLDYQCLLLTNLVSNSEEKGKEHYPTAQEITSPITFSVAALNKRFTVLNGQYDQEGFWNIQIDILNSGPLFL